MTETVTDAHLRGLGAHAASGLEVATRSADATRARVTVSGTVSTTTLPLLTSILRTHMAAGRRIVLVDFGDAAVTNTTLGALVDVHLALNEAGGMLVCEATDPDTLAALTAGDLFVHRD